jgi:Mg-chelatase subunit ChlD
MSPSALPGARVSEVERLRRWRLVLGDTGDAAGPALGAADRRIDAALAAIYDRAPAGSRTGVARSAGLGRSVPAVSRWLGDIRRYFPATVVQVLQRDAVDRLGLRRLLLEPELLDSLAPDVHLVATIVELGRLLPDESRASARRVVREVVEQLERRLAERTRAAVRGALARSVRTRRPRPADIDWDRTIRANLQHWLPAHGTIVPARLVGSARRQRSLVRDVVIAVDQSGSMAESVVYAALYGSVLASLPSLRTTLLAFDTAVVDLTPLAGDPVDVLFGVQLGGGTDIAGALAACQQVITRPSDTLVVLVSDLYEGGSRELLLARAGALVGSGATVVVLLALSDEGAPAHDHALASELAGLGIAAFACTPDAFPDLLAAALDRRDLARWASEHGMVTAAPPG